jgi:DNA-binding winged helix-turn-helix (wHTH) protein/Tol biopolymer transport system component
MNGATKRGRLVRFSVFDVDLDSGELFKQGRKVKLQGQPFELLRTLLHRPGEVITREELKQKVWPSDTVVDFDHGLNRAMNKLREALGDSAESAHFIETLPRRGYRFLGSIQDEGSAEPPAAPTSPQASIQSTEQLAKPRSRRKNWLLAAAIAGSLALASLAIWMTSDRPLGTSDLRVQQLTTNSAENPVSKAVISPDGKFLAYGDLTGIQIRLITTGETHVLPKPPTLSLGDTWSPAAWFPDGTRILASSVHLAPQGPVVSGWTVSVIGGTVTRLRDNALVYSVSPDGSLIAFTTGSGSYMTSLQDPSNARSKTRSEIWVMGPRGENARRVVAGGDLTYFSSVRWSPDGKRIAYRKFRFATEQFAEYTIESRDLNGGAPSAILSKRQSYFYAALSLGLPVVGDFCWTPDGRRVIYAVPEPSPNHRDRNLWEIAVNPKTGKVRGVPRRITNLAGFLMENLSLAGDGRKLVFETGSDESHVYVGRVLPGGNLETPKRLTLDERYNSPYAWTADSKAVIFSSDRTGTFSIYKQALDQNVPELISTGPEATLMARVSPDGNWLIYAALSNVKFPNQSDFVRLMRVPMAGGAPQMILESKGTTPDFDCPDRTGAQCVINERSADTKQLFFHSLDPLSGRLHPLFKLVIPGEKPVNFAISPDGSRIAMTGADPQGGIEIRSLNGHIESTIEVKGPPNPMSMAINWAADGKSLLLSHSGLMGSPSGSLGATLLRVDLQGNVQPLWEMKGGRFTWAIPSPDGRYLAVLGAASQRNTWMVENF